MKQINYNQYHRNTKNPKEQLQLRQQIGLFTRNKKSPRQKHSAKADSGRHCKSEWIHDELRDRISD